MYTSIDLLVALVFHSLVLFFVYFLLNHAELFAKIRDAVLPVLPWWISYPITCSLCFAFWATAALSLFVGWTPLLLASPPCVLLLDCAYRRLKPPDSPSE